MLIHRIALEKFLADVQQCIWILKNYASTSTAVFEGVQYHVIEKFSQRVEKLYLVYVTDSINHVQNDETIFSSAVQKIREELSRSTDNIKLTMLGEINYLFVILNDLKTNLTSFQREFTKFNNDIVPEYKQQHQNGFPDINSRANSIPMYLEQIESNLIKLRDGSLKIGQHFATLHVLIESELKLLREKIQPLNDIDQNIISWMDLLHTLE